MTKIKIDDSWEFNIFRLIEKFYTAPEKLTRKEYIWLKRLGYARDEKAN